MNTVALDATVFDNFEAADMNYLADIEAGDYSWGGFFDSVGQAGIGGMAGGAATGALTGAAGGTMVFPGVGTVAGAGGCAAAGGIIGGIGGMVTGAANYLVSGGD
ncbi:Uncharacterised protein [Streptococcus criceti]|uniref:Bacteriocin class II with double-glycine leader peptide n=1 Tax=Streptococcus criceti HS-6 TaxID=873449 RepID=G5JMR7_STRCG|nr:hypothetical protein [Streptococcus criceti]EHI74035.1 hypothetical protein STRCR_0031 [Streptococcus criceti HS-6]SUN41548.1 Uncharacterised protein [Streptococcus criceti]